MTKKALIVIMAAVLVLGVIGVMAQDGPGVIKITLPDGKSVPVFTDGRLNAFDIAAPVVVYYTAADGAIVNPDYTSGTQPDLSSLNFSNPNTFSSITAAMNNGDNNAAASNGSNTTVLNSANANSIANQAGLINKLEVLAIDPTTSNGNLVLNPTVDDLLGLVTGQHNSIATKGYSINFDPKSNYFWVQSPANFEGKVYTFAWPNNLFPLSLVGHPVQTNAQAVAQPAQSQTQSQTQATTQTQPTMQPTPST
jgi:hypothetical protein